MKNKKLVLILLVFAFIFISVGISYAYFIFLGNTSNKGEFIAGDIYMHFVDTDAFSFTTTRLENIDDARDRDDNMLNFTISGDNSSDKDIIYSISLKHGEDVARSTRILDKAARFDLVETTSGDEEYLVNAASFDDFDNKIIYVSTIDGGTHNYERTFYVRAWISDEVIISDTDPNADFCASSSCASELPVLTSVFMNFKVEVHGDFEDKTRDNYNKTIINFDAGDSNFINNIEVTSNALISGLPLIEKPGEAFAGWYYNDTLVDDDFVVPDLYSIGLTAHFTTTNVSASVFSLESDNTTLYMIANGVDIDPDLYKYDGETISVVYDVPVNNTNNTVPWVNELYFTATTFNIGESVSSFKPTSLNCWFGWSMSTDESPSHLRTINGLENIDTSNVTSLKSTFANTQYLTSIDISSWDVTNVTYIGHIFENCQQLVDLRLPDMSQCEFENIYYAFKNCLSIESIDVSNWDVSAVRDFSEVFRKCTSLKTLDVSNWNTSNARSFYALFAECESLKNIAVENWDVHRATTFEYMFYSCWEIVSFDLSNWDTTNLQSTKEMFKYCYSLVDVNLCGWVVTNLTNTIEMFNDDTILEFINADDWTSVITISDTNSKDMFRHCYLLPNYDDSSRTFVNAHSGGYFTSIPG